MYAIKILSDPTSVPPDRWQDRYKILQYSFHLSIISFTSVVRQPIPWWFACKPLLATVETKLWWFRSLALVCHCGRPVVPSATQSELAMTMSKIPSQNPYRTPKPCNQRGMIHRSPVACPVLLIIHVFNTNLLCSPGRHLSVKALIYWPITW